MDLNKIIFTISFFLFWSSKFEFGQVKITDLVAQSKG